MCIRSRNEWCVTARSSTCSVSSLKEVDWKELYAIAKKQALLGEQYGRMYMEKYRYIGRTAPSPYFFELLFGDGA